MGTCIKDSIGGWQQLDSCSDWCSVFYCAVRSHTHEAAGVQSSGSTAKHASSCLGLWPAEYRCWKTVHQTNGSPLCKTPALIWLLLLFIQLYCNMLVSVLCRSSCYQTITYELYNYSSRFQTVFNIWYSSTAIFFFSDLHWKTLKSLLIFAVLALYHEFNVYMMLVL